MIADHNKAIRKLGNRELIRRAKLAEKNALQVAEAKARRAFIEYMARASSRSTPVPPMRARPKPKPKSMRSAKNRN